LFLVGDEEIVKRLGKKILFSELVTFCKENENEDLDIDNPLLIFLDEEDHQRWRDIERHFYEQ